MREIGSFEAKNKLSALLESGAFAPSLWPLEALNGLLMAERRRRLDGKTPASACGLSARPAHYHVGYGNPDQAWTATARLAERYRLTLYNAAYLELAQRRRLPLATLDQDLIAAGKALGMTLLGTGT